jgi:NADH:ubiquinone oxidoreductase subunit E
MTRERQRPVARAVAAVGAVSVLIGAGLLVADYAAARVRMDADAARVVELQAQARTDAAAARRLEAEQDRITRARRARKARSNAASIFLVAASAVFLAGAKWLVALKGPRPEAPLTLVRVHVRSAARTAGAPAVPRASPLTPAVTAIDLTFVDRIVNREGTSTEAVIRILQAIQSQYRYLPDEALRRVVELTDATPAQVAGTSSFYARFRRSPVGEHVVRICHGTACHVSGARQIDEELRRHLGIPDGADTDPARRFTLDEVACLGCCSLAPVLMVDDRTAGRLTPATAADALERVAREAQPA